MSKFIIQGGNRLSGSIRVNGAKNAALKIIPAALLSNQQITIHNMPQIEDIDRSLEIFQDLGGSVEKNKRTYTLKIDSIKKNLIKPSLANKLRASIMFVGPMLARLGEVKFPHPGGCVIGAGIRPIDFFLEGFQAMGANVEIANSYYHIKAKKLKGCKYFFPRVSVTGTESLMMTAVLAEGVTILNNCAMEPEVTALAEYLNEQGAKITGAGTPTITITGVKTLRAGEYHIIPDRIEAGTLAILAVATKSNLKINNCIPEHLDALLNVFDKIGVKYVIGKNWIEIKQSKGIDALSIKTHEYPGFPTDLQSPYTVLMTQANGSSIIHETIYDRRLLFTDMLNQMGANIIMADPHRVVINGPAKLVGRRLTSPDLRAGISMVIAGLIAKGTTEIDNIYQIDRGYENIDKRLKRLGADIKRVN
ncbi:MAG: UDP-N-acetylglucosamine 1-carboxyvinyltransferase [bacterium]